MKKCKYCGKKLKDNFEFCNSKCENCYEKMMDKDSHKIKYFILGIILGFVVMFYGIISNNNVFIIGIGIIVMGMDVCSCCLLRNLRQGSVHLLPPKLRHPLQLQLFHLC